MIGYPNVGKSSIINTLRKKKVCKVAPIAGETKVWQYITLMRRIYLIDCPGVVYPSAETDTEKVLKGVVRVELVNNPEDYIETVLARVREDYIKKTYRIESWSSPTDFLEKMAARSGKLLKGGEPDIGIAARMILNDWQRGKLPFYVPPPGFEVPLSESSNKENVKLVQDFSKIKVGFTYEGEDIKELAPIDKEKAVDEFADTSINEDVDGEISKEEDSINADTTNEETKDDISEEDVDSSDNSDMDMKEIYSDAEEEKEYAISTSGPFKVESIRSKKSISNTKEDENTPIKLTSKQRRAIDRAQKRKKIGTNFYEVSNVKNRSYRKKKNPTKS